jgi:hypothetical protein
LFPEHPKIVEHEERPRLPDFEIRYFNADGTLAVVYVAHCASIEEADEHARLYQQNFARFEIVEVT